jgi:hypothetical protein
VQCEVLGITICSHRDLEELLKGFNQANNEGTTARAQGRLTRAGCAPSPSRVTSRPIQMLCPMPFKRSQPPRGLTSRQSVSLYAGWYKLIKFRKAQLDAGGG